MCIQRRTPAATRKQRARGPFGGARARTLPLAMPYVSTLCLILALSTPFVLDQLSAQLIKKPLIVSAPLHSLLPPTLPVRIQAHPGMDTTRHTACLKRGLHYFKGADAVAMGAPAPTQAHASAITSKHRHTDASSHARSLARSWSIYVSRSPTPCHKGMHRATRAYTHAGSQDRARGTNREGGGDRDGGRDPYQV